MTELTLPTSSRLKGEVFDYWYSIPRPSEEEVGRFLYEAWGKPLAVDTETSGDSNPATGKGLFTTGLYDGRSYATGVSGAFRDDNGNTRSHYFPFRHKGPGNYSDTERRMLQTLILGAPFIVFHNAKIDLASLCTLGIVYKGLWYDTAIMAHLLNENRPFSKSLNDCLKFYVGPNVAKAMSPDLQAVIDAYGWANVPASHMRKYATEDAALTWILFDALWPLWEKENLDAYWREQKQPLVNVVAEMERRGIKVDLPYVRKRKEAADNAMNDYRYELGDLDPGSHKSLEKHLVVKLGIPPYIVEKPTKKRQPDGTYVKTIKSSLSFDSKAFKAHWGPHLERMGDSDLAQSILAYRGWQQAGSLFYGSYLDHVSPDGRIRPKYAHHKDDEDGGTVTGRLACSEPNLQQIPKKSTKAWNGGVKRSFIPQAGYELWEVDYSQLELRLATAYAKEETLIAVFNEGRDIFTELSQTLGLTRDATKMYVYMTQYAAGIKKIATALNISEDKAAKIREDYYRAYPGFRKMNLWAMSFAKRNRYIPLWSGRRRHFVNPQNEAFKAMNSMIQGGAADIVERKMIEVYNTIDIPSNNEVRMLLQVHDSVIFEIKSGTTDKWIPRITDTMSNVNNLTPNGFGITWAVEAKPLHENYKGEFSVAA